MATGLSGCFRTWCWLLAGACLACGAARGAPAEEKMPAVNYDDHIKPIFREKCLACHNTDKKTGGLDLSSYPATMAGGSSGSVIEPGSSAESHLYALVSHAAEPYMPPKADKLPADTLKLIAAWIDGGALENSGSKAALPKKPKVDLTLKDVPTGRPEGPPPMPMGLSLQPVTRAARATAPRTLATSPWAPLAALAGQKQVLLYNTQTLELAGVLHFPEGQVNVLRFSRNGLLLLAAGGRGAATGRAVVWNVKTGERLFEVGDELDAVLAADISADQSLIVLGGPSKVVRVYSTADGTLKYELKKHTDWIFKAAFSPDGVLLATADRNGGLIVWEAQTGREFLVLGGHGSAVTGLSWRIDSNILASASEDSTIRLWEMENGGLVKNWGAHSGGAASVEFARDGRLVSCGRDRLARLWDQNGAEQKSFSGCADIALCAAYCDETNRVFAGDWTGTIRAWNAADAQPLGTLDANPPTLAERHQEAQNALTTRAAELQAAAARQAAAEADLARQKAALAAAEKTLADARSAAKTAEEQAASLRAAIDSHAQDRSAAAKLADTLAGLVPLLKEGHEKAAAAAARQPDDKDLAAAVEQVKGQLARKAGQLEEARKIIADRDAKIEAAKTSLAQAEKKFSDAKAALEPAMKQVADATAPVAGLENKLAEATQARAMAAQLLEQANAALERWKQELQRHQSGP